MPGLFQLLSLQSEHTQVLKTFLSEPRNSQGSDAREQGLPSHPVVRRWRSRRPTAGRHLRRIVQREVAGLGVEPPSAGLLLNHTTEFRTLITSQARGPKL